MPAMNINSFTSSHDMRRLNLSALKLYLIRGAQFVMHKQITLIMIIKITCDRTTLMPHRTTVCVNRWRHGFKKK